MNRNRRYTIYAGLVIIAGYIAGGLIYELGKWIYGLM